MKFQHNLTKNPKIGQLSRNRIGLGAWAYATKDGQYIGLVEKLKIINSSESIYQRVRSGLRLAYDPSAVSGSRLISLSCDQLKLAVAELDGTISIWTTKDLTPLHHFTIDTQPASGIRFFTVIICF